MTTLKRYGVNPWLGMEPEEGGKWVRYDDVDTLISQLRNRLSDLEGWNEDMTKAPRDGTRVLLYRFCDPWHVRGWGYWVSIRGIEGWISHGFYDPPGNLGLAEPTHWRPISASPSPPIDGEKEIGS